MDNWKSIPIVTWKLTKNCSHIISDISIPGWIPYSGFDHSFKLDADSPSMSKKDIGLLYRPIERLLLSYKVTRPATSDCVSYIIARMESSTKYHKAKQLNVDVLFVKKIQLFILSSVEIDVYILNRFFLNTISTYWIYSNVWFSHESWRQYLPFWESYTII